MMGCGYGGFHCIFERFKLFFFILARCMTGCAIGTKVLLPTARHLSHLTETEIQQDRISRQEEGKQKKILATTSIFFGRIFFKLPYFSDREGAPILPGTILHETTAVCQSVISPHHLEACQQILTRSLLFFSGPICLFVHSHSIASSIRPFLAPIQSVSEAELRS